MSPTNTCVVFGFNSGFDWRPTLFVNGIPSNKVCSACGLVSSKSALLPCRHVLCLPCYDASGSGRKCCPVEKEQFEDDDVVWTNFGKENLLSRTIQCWNAPTGCSAVGSACEVLEHFDKECDLHPVDCLRCHKRIPHKDVIKHLGSADCCSPSAGETIATKSADGDICRATEMLGQLEQRLSCLHEYLREKLEVFAKSMECSSTVTATEEGVADTLSSLGEMVKENSRASSVAVLEIKEAALQLNKQVTAVEQYLQQINEQMKEFKTWWKCSADEYEETPAYVNINRETKALLFGSQPDTEEQGNITGVNEAVRRHAEVRPASADELERFRAEVHEKLCLLVTASNAILENTHRVSKPLKWSIFDWTKTKNTANLEGKIEVFAEKPKYFYGYSFLPGILIVTKEGVQALRFVIQVHKGAYDHLLTWPVAKKLCLKVLHPTDAEKTISVSLDTGMHAVPGFQLPTGPKNKGVLLERKILVGDLEGIGFVAEDKLNFKFEVFP
ncbi:TNF receptor-associated factor 3-like [Haemaphysalis longicornis]